MWYWYVGGALWILVVVVMLGIEDHVRPKDDLEDLDLP